MKTVRQLFNLSRKFKIIQIVSSAAYKDTKNKRVARSEGGISTDIRFRPNLSIFPGLSQTPSQGLSLGRGGKRGLFPLRPYAMTRTAARMLL